jgi:DNA-binding response OmpR family regulator
LVGAVAELDGRGEPVPSGGADEPPSLLIAVAPSAAERIRLAELLEGVAPLLLVADLDELRRLISLPQPLQQGAATAAPADVLTIDEARGTVRLGRREVDLTRLEYNLLTCLHSEPIRPWSYAELHRTVWRDAELERKADVQSLVKRLRRKLAQLGTGITIDAVRGVGFRLTDHQRPRVSGGGPFAVDHQG